MSTETTAHNEPLDVARRWLWIGLITAASLAFSRVFACAMPFVALAALAALNMRRGEAAALMLIVWTLNQAVGFLLLHYPHTAGAYEWGLAIGLAAFVALGAAIVAISWARTSAWVQGGAAFVVAFALYELTLYANGLALHDSGAAFAPAVVGKMLEVNAAAFAGLLVLNAIAVRVRLVPSPRRPAFA